MMRIFFKAANYFILQFIIYTPINYYYRQCFYFFLFVFSLYSYETINSIFKNIIYYEF